MGNLDRRIIYLLILLGVAIPLIIPFGLPIEDSEYVRRAFKLIDSMEPGTPVLFSFDYDPASQAELHPMALAMVRHAQQKQCRVFVMALWPMGVMLSEDVFERLEAEGTPFTRGKDFVNLGFKTGGMVTMQAACKNMRVVFPTDTKGTPLDSLEIMKGIRGLEDFGFVASLSAGVPGIKEWVMVAHDKYNIPVTGGTTAVSSPSLMPYVNDQNQLTGLLGSLKAAAEYEMLLNAPGPATTRMDAQSVAHIVIIGFIVLGNIAWFRKKRRSKKE